MYSVSSYAKMVADAIRMDAYRLAMSRVVKPGSIVLDLGTGLGISALLACRLGARRVYAIEPSDVIQIAYEIASANGVADRIQFLQDYSFNVDLPERVDAIVSDLRGILPLFGRHVPAIIDARSRWLASDGVLIPQRDCIWAALVEAPELYCSSTCPWQDDDLDLDMTAVRKLLTNTMGKCRIQADQLLTPHQLWATLDYQSINDVDVSQELTWTVGRAGMAHGLCLWFDTTLIEGVGFSNAPGSPELIYGNAFLPFAAPVSLEAGEVISVKLCADLVGDDYVWRWHTRVLDLGEPPKARIDYRQSTFFSAPITLARLRKRAAAFVPQLSLEGDADRNILSLMDGGHSLGEIAGRVFEVFPHHFSTYVEALTRVGELSLKYSQ